MRNNIHTIRGTLDWTHAQDPWAQTEAQQIYLDNMDPTRNFKVVDFVVFPSGPAYVTNSLWSLSTHLVVLATKKSGAKAGLTAQPDEIQGLTVRDNRQIGWCVWDSAGPGTMQQPILDPEHLVVSDLWINGWQINAGTGVSYTLNQPVSYIITLEAVTTTVDMALMTLLKERAQDTLAH